MLSTAIVGMALLMALLDAPDALAQEPSGARGAASLLEEVVVSARKKSESEAAQSVPISISTYNGNQIEAMFADTVTDVAMRMPNVQLEAQGTVPSVASFYVRGMGSSDSLPSTDPSVGTFVDGMYIGVPYGVVTDVFDLESVQVLKGPQGTLFGRNVTAGAVLLESRMPSGDFGFKAKSVAGNDKRRDVYLSVENGFTETLSGKIGYMYKSNDDWVESIAPGADNVGSNEISVVRPILSWHPTDSLSLDFISELGTQKVTTSASKLTESAQQDFGVELGDFEISNDFTDSSDIDWWHTILRASYDLENGTIRSITTYRELELDSPITDSDASPLSIFFVTESEETGFDQHQFSQELIYSSYFGDRLDWTSGLYYFEQEYTYIDDWRSAALGFAPDVGGGTVEHMTYGAFAQFDARITDKLILTLGGRYTKEEKEAINVVGHFAQVACPSLPILPGCDFSDKEEWNSFSPKAGLQYFVNDDVQLYGSWTKGQRSGGYNIRVSSPANSPGPYDEEEVEAFEIGMKSTWMDGRLRLNAALFHNQYDDLQRTLTVPGEFGFSQRIVNAAEATFQGVEIDIAAAITDSFIVTLSGGYIDASYDSFEGLDLDGDAVADPEGAKALDLPHVPELTYTLSATYDHNLHSGYLSFNGSYMWTDERAADDLNTIKLDDYALLDASVSYTFANEDWKITAFGKNLTDEEWFSNGFTLSFTSYTFVQRHRTFGVEVSYEF